MPDFSQIFEKNPRHISVANLDSSVAERQREQVLRRLGELSRAIEIEILRLSSPSKGTVLLLLAEFENSHCCFQSLGARGKPAERVGDEAVGELLDFLTTDGTVDQFLCDQLVLPLALAKGVSEIRTSKVTLHLVRLKLHVVRLPRRLYRQRQKAVIYLTANRGWMS